MKKTVSYFRMNVYVKEQTIMMPRGAEILTVRTIGNSVAVYALVDAGLDATDTEGRTIELYGSDQPIHYDTAVSRKYICTFEDYLGFLNHAFERAGV